MKFRILSDTNIENEDHGKYFLPYFLEFKIQSNPKAILGFSGISLKHLLTLLIKDLTVIPLRINESARDFR